MLAELLISLCNELDIEKPEMTKEKTCTFNFQKNISIFMGEIENTIYIKSTIAPTPKENKEDLFITLMKANLLGDGTGGSVIGLEKDEKNLTLSYLFQYEVTYDEFKEKIEDFVNYLIYWREEIKNFPKERIL